MKQATWMDRTWWRDCYLAMTTCLLTVVLSTALGAQQPPTHTTVLGSAGMTALGTLALALILVRWTPYPRWGYFGAAAVLVGGALFSTVLIGDLVVWTKQVRAMLWMHPWFFLVMTLFAPRGGARGCAPTAPWAGWLLIGTATLLVAISSGAALIVLRL